MINGVGPEEKPLKALCKSENLQGDVTFLYAKDKDIFFQSIDIFCSPCALQKCGRQLLEAMAQAKPCVATDCDANTSLAEDDVSALIVPRDDASAMAKALTQLCRDSDASHRIAMGGYGVAEAHDIRAVSQALSEAVEAVTESYYSKAPAK
jgi:glycosyltransferase involved in cell wall biosynthesis